jgi:hypothetical protein
LRLDFHRQYILNARVCHALTVAGCINWAAACQGAQNLDRTTHSSRNPAVNLNLGEPFRSIRRLHMPNWLSAATSLAAKDARVWKNALTKRTT